MKTAIKTFIAFTFTAIVLTATTATTFATDGEKVTTLNEVKKANKISVSGNVELILVQNAEESIKIYDDYYSKNAFIQQKDGELRISSFDQKPLTVVVYVNNVTSITAANDARVRTSGKLSSLNLDVKLSDNAVATLNVNAIEVNTNITGTAKLNLNGSAEIYTGVMGSAAKVSMENFNAETKQVQSKATVVAKAKFNPVLYLPEAE